MLSERSTIWANPPLDTFQSFVLHPFGFILIHLIEDTKRRRRRDPGSNQGPLDLQSNALPTELSRLVMVSPIDQWVHPYRHAYSIHQKEDLVKKNRCSTQKGFEPSRGNPNGLAVHRLNHSATASLRSISTMQPHFSRFHQLFGSWLVKKKELNSREADLNHRPKDVCNLFLLQSSALPAELSRVPAFPSPVLFLSLLSPFSSGWFAAH